MTGYWITVYEKIENMETLKKYAAKSTTAINKYTWVLINKWQNKNLLLKYSKSELVDNKKKIKHRLIKEIMKKYNFKGLDINFIADLPNRAGLGSSSSFTIALLGALEKFKGKKLNKKKLAEMACDIEIKKLKDPIGKQDQYISAFGGFYHITFKKNNVIVKKINIGKNYVVNEVDMKYFKETFESILFNDDFFGIFRMDKIKKFLLEVI